jgi:hypothetical protein
VTSRKSTSGRCASRRSCLSSSPAPAPHELMHDFYRKTCGSQAEHVYKNATSQRNEFNFVHSSLRQKQATVKYFSFCAFKLQNNVSCSKAHDERLQLQRTHATRRPVASGRR